MTVTLVALSMTSATFLPGILTTNERTPLLVISLAVGCSAGLFEELGWTGFAIPALLRRDGVTATGVTIGIWWSAWHLLPNIWASGAASGDLAMPVYLAAIAIGIVVGYLTAFRILMVWVYDHTESLSLSMLMHASFTASLLILNPLGLSGTPLQIYSLSLAAAVWIVVAAIASRSGWRGHEPSVTPSTHERVEAS
jgi:membrane protease YdiL (CAAX protease family)